MDRIIKVNVGGNYISKDNKNAGVRGEANVTYLRITFDEGWDKYAKKVTFWDARGGNPVERTLTTDLLENIKENTRVYLVPIPAEPMAEAGTLTFVIDGFYEGKRQRSISDQLEVKDAPIADNAGEPTDPTPTQAEQLQGQIEEILGDIKQSAIARDQAEVFKNEAAQYAEEAERLGGKASYIGDNGNWYAWDSKVGNFYDTGVKAQAGSTVYVGENPPDDADVWINPNGETVEYATKAELLELANKVAPSPASITLYADRWKQGNEGNMWYQVVVVANATITEFSKIDLQPSPEQLCVFYEKDLAFVTENEDGVVTVYCIGQKPTGDYTIQATVMEVTING